MNTIRVLMAAAAGFGVAACMSHLAEERPLNAASDTSTAARPAIGEFGLDLAARDLTVRPGDDFFAYAGGKWTQTFEIPGDRASYSVFNELDERAKERVREIIAAAGAAHPAPGSEAQKIGDFYASFLDEALLEQRGLAAAHDDLARIHAATDKRAIATLFGATGFASLFDLDLPPDLRDPTRYSVLIGQSSLGLPERDYYLGSDPALVRIRTQYVAYIEEMLSLAHVPDAGHKARLIMSFETRAARLQWPIERRRDVDATYNPRTKAQLEAYAPGFPWQAFLDASQLGARRDLVLGELTAIRDLAALYAEMPVATLQAWLEFHYLSDHAQYLPRRFDAARFGFYGRALRGQPEEAERWKRGIEQVNESLGELVGRAYVARYFPPESKTQLLGLVQNLRAALGDRIDHLDWMTPATKARARAKLATFHAKIGYPDEWKDYSTLEIRRSDLIGNVRRAAQWQWDYQVARLDRPVDRDEWQMNPQEINAYYNPLNNEVVFPAALLEPPFFDPNADAAVNYGAIGSVIGHEMGHGFDDQGRKFGPTGALQDWWTPADEREFGARVQRLIAQFSAFEALPGLHVNGANTVGENIGDLGGLDMAYHAYQLSLQGRPAPVLEGLTGAQRFFLSWAQVWRTKYRDGALREIVLSDVHSPARFRVNGPLSNIDAWYAAFDVRPGEDLYRRPEERVSIW